MSSRATPLSVQENTDKKYALSAITGLTEFVQKLGKKTDSTG